MASLFTQIVNGDIPAHVVYEDEHTLAFMDLNPVRPGHVLVITKKEVETFEKLSEDEFAQLMRSVHKVANKIKEVFRPERVGLLIEGFEVPHVHVKLIPIDNEIELREMPNSTEPDHEALAEIAKKLKID